VKEAGMERYEEWDVTLPSIPPRSCLYHLDPVGVETPSVESFTSYVARLAGAHCVTPRALISKVIFPLQGKVDTSPNFSSRLNAIWHRDASTLNGTSPVASEWVETVQAITTCSHLRFLTMLSFRDVVAMKRLLRQRKAWCPSCYEEWRCQNQVVYEPLLWALSGIDLCPRHHQWLVTQCPHCSKTLPSLTQTMRPGYCPYCMGFLGKLQKPSEKEEEKMDMEWQYWKAKTAGDLLALAPHLLVPPSQEHIARRLQVFVDDYAAGNMSALARFLGITVQALWGYIHHGNAPFFDTLLKMCHCFSLTLGEFLTTTLPSPFIQKKPRFSLENIPIIISGGKGHPVTEEDIQLMRQTLEAVISADDQSDQFPRLKEIARRMGVAVLTVQRHCPDLSQAIVLRYRRSWKEEGNHTKMKQALEMSLARAIPEPLSDVARRLQCNGMVLREHFPDLCRAIVTRYREQIDYAQIEQRLQEVLASQEEVPAVAALAREMGYSRHILDAKFPHLCHQIAARRYAERNRRHQEWVAAEGEKIRQVVLQLHKENVYPGIREVVRRTGNVFWRKEAREAWRLTLQELGYPTDTFRKPH